MLLLVRDVVVVVTMFCRSHAIACVNPFIIGRSQALMAHVDSFIEVFLFLFVIWTAKANGVDITHLKVSSYNC